MKKTLLFLGLLPAFVGISQTIATSDTLTATDVTQYYAVDTSTSNLSTVVGAGVTWDYSNIVMINDNPPSTDSVIYIADSPHSADFPNAQYHEQFNNGVQSFFSNDGNEVTIHGFIFNSGSDYIIKYNTDPLIGLQLPMALGDIINDPIAGEAIVPLAGTVVLSGSATVNADGTGTLLLAGNTYTNTIRVRTEEITTGTALGQNIVFTRISYAYYVPNNDFPVFVYGEIIANLSVAGTLNLKLIWSKDSSFDNLAIKDQTNKLKLNIYPNPANEFVNVNSSENAKSILVFNTIGEIVFEKENPSENEKIDLTSFNSGIYFIQLKNEEGILTRKLVVK